MNFINSYQGMERMQKTLAIQAEKGSSFLQMPRCLELALSTLGWEIKGSYVCIVLKSAFFSKVSQREIPDDELFERSSLMVKTGTEIFFLCNLLLISGGVDEIAKRLEKILKDSPLIAGVSTPFRSFLDYPDYCTQHWLPYASETNWITRKRHVYSGILRWITSSMRGGNPCRSMSFYSEG